MNVNDLRDYLRTRILEGKRYFFNDKTQVTFDRIEHIGKRTFRCLYVIGRKVYQWTRGGIKKIAFKDDTFHLWKCVGNLMIGICLWFLLPIVGMGLYYYATWAQYDEILIPNAGVTVNQQFVRPSQPGAVVAPRDEVFTVLGHHIDRGVAYPVRMDVDANPYFFWKSHAWRPDLNAGLLVPQSPHGAICSVQTTGLYARLPRYLRLGAVRWLDLRLEIIDVLNCHQLTEVQYRQYETIINRSEL